MLFIHTPDRGKWVIQALSLSYPRVFHTLINSSFYYLLLLFLIASEMICAIFWAPLPLG